MSVPSETLPPETLLEMQRRMLRIRYFDERASKMVKRGHIPGTVHTSIGQEAQVVGATMALGDQDFMSGNHRSHGHPIGKGSPLGPLMAELVGKSDGVCGGKGGSLHLADFSVGSLGESGIIGSSIPIATGAALSSKVLGNGKVALAFFGDGGANQGGLYESMNISGVWKLPVVFLCENNQYALSTPAHTVTSGVIADRAAGFGMPGVRVEDGQDVESVYDAVKEAVDRARGGDGPSLVEVVTYRYNEHSEGLRLGVDYRNKEEKEAWLRRDPIVLFRAKLIERGVATAEEMDALEAEVLQEVDDAVKFTDESPFPDPSRAFADLYTEPFGPTHAERGPAPLIGSTRGGAKDTEPVPAPGNGLPPDHDHRRSSAMTVMSYLGAIGAAQKEAMQADERVVIIGEDVEANVYGTTGGSGKSRAVGGRLPPAVRPQPDPQHPDLGGGHRGGRGRRGDDRAAPDRRPVVLELPVPGDGPVREPGRQEPLHVRRPGLDPRGVPLGDVLRAQHRRAPLRPAIPDVHERPRPQDRRAGLPVGRQGPAAPGGRLRRPGAHLRGVHAVGYQGGGARGGVPHPVRAGPHPSRGLRRHDRRDLHGRGPEALKAAEELAQQGISAEVIDPRTLVPLDIETVIRSVQRTGRLVVADPAHRTCGAAAEISALVAEEAFESLRAPIVRVTTPDTQIPFSPALERQLYPNRTSIAEAVRQVTGEPVKAPDDLAGIDEDPAHHAPR